MSVNNYEDLKPMTYTIALKPTTKIKNKIESSIDVNRGDYIMW